MTRLLREGCGTGGFCLVMREQYCGRLGGGGAAGDARAGSGFILSRWRWAVGGPCGGGLGRGIGWVQCGGVSYTCI